MFLYPSGFRLWELQNLIWSAPIAHLARRADGFVSIGLQRCTRTSKSTVQLGYCQRADPGESSLRSTNRTMQNHQQVLSFSSLMTGHARYRELHFRLLQIILPENLEFRNDFANRIGTTNPKQFRISHGNNGGPLRNSFIRASILEYVVC